MTAPEDLTLMAVHTHPDDEASSTGGALARYSAEGARTILVTCTNGELGDAPGGIKPDQEGFDEDLVVTTRRAELEASCELLGIRHLERLGYSDSGMMGWAANDDPRSFWKMPVEATAQPLIELIEMYRPQVLVTYDAYGFYGHPDHIQAHRITVFAAESTGIAAKLYFPTIPGSRLGEFAAALDAAGVGDDGPRDDGPRDDPNFGTPDEDVTTYLDCSDYVAIKRAALEAHRSQTETSFFLKLPAEFFERTFGYEAYVRSFDTTGASVPEDDLFAGLR